MTRSPVALSTAPLEHVALDFAALRREGVRELERLAASQWTDFNVHDPGITILEQCCYAITDLGYRIAHDVPDLLAEGARDTRVGAFGPAGLLTTRPVTLLDRRKLVCDVEGVLNAWIEPARPALPLHYHAGSRELRFEPDPPSTEPLDIAGLFLVRVAKSDRADAATVRREVMRRLSANRGLCEDYDVEIMDAQPIEVASRVEIDADDPERVLLDIYEHIADYLMPPVRFLTFGQMLQAGKRIDDIFDGPLLEHGFIDDEALARAGWRSAVYTSDVIREIMDVPGVRAVRDLTVALRGSLPRAWAVELPTGSVPRLSLDAPTIVLTRSGVPVRLDRGKVLEAYSSRQSRRSTGASSDVLPEAPRGRPRDVARYRSIQHELPALYGVGPGVVPESAAPERKGRAKQLKAYLMFFDQLLANAFAQVARLGDLFSFTDGSLHSYFSQPVPDEGLGLDELRTRPDAGHTAWLAETVEGAVERRLGGAVEPTHPVQRKQRFLNHLLARVAEDFSNYSLISAEPGAQERAAADTRLAAAKAAFLRAYPRVSSTRGTGFDYLAPAHPDNCSGLEQRLRLELGLVESDGERLYVIEHILLRPVLEDEGQRSRAEDPPIAWLAAMPRRDPYSLQLSVVLPGWPARFSAARSDDAGGGSSLRPFIERTIRMETPAHLTPIVHWLDAEPWARFEAAIRDWQTKHRAHVAARLGL